MGAPGAANASAAICAALVASLSNTFDALERPNATTNTLGAVADAGVSDVSRAASATTTVPKRLRMSNIPEGRRPQCVFANVSITR